MLIGSLALLTAAQEIRGTGPVRYAAVDKVMAEVEAFMAKAKQLLEYACRASSGAMSP